MQKVAEIMQVLFHEHSEHDENEFQVHGDVILELVEKCDVHDVVLQVQLVDEHDENDEIIMHIVAVVGNLDMHDVQQVEKTDEHDDHEDDMIC